MTGLENQLREMFGDYVTTDQLSNIIPDQSLLATAIQSLDAEKEGSIPIQKLANFINQHQKSNNDGGLTRTSSTEDYPPSDSVNDSYQEHWSEEEDLISANDHDIAKLSRRTPRARMRTRQRDAVEFSDTEDYNGNESNMQLMQRVQELEETQQMLRNQLEQSRQDTFKLRQQVHELDEGLREAETERDLALRNSAQHHHDDYIRLEREKKLQEDDWRTNRTELESERDELKTELFKLRHKYDKQNAELSELTQKVDEHQQRAVLQLEKYQQLTEQSGNEREYMQHQTKLAHEINIDQMQQIEELKGHNSLMSERIVELSTLEPIVAQTDTPFGDDDTSLLREENDRLNEMIEDLNLQLLNQHVSRARALSEQREIDNELIDEEPVEVVQGKYKKLQDTHQDLRMYLERILDNIMERDPTLLEIPAK